MKNKQKQTQLKYLGFYFGAIDGILGDQSKEATKKFQKQYGLAVDGIFGPATENKSIEIWKDIQTKLNVRGYGLTVDGYCGTNTQNAILKFQKDYLLASDNICGPTTRAYINAWSYAKNFELSEFKCPKHCGGYPVNINPSLLIVCQDIRNKFGNSFNITSGIRCKTFNNGLDGSTTNSKHMSGEAVDFYITGIDKSKVLAYCKQLVKQGKLKYTYTNDTNMGRAVHINL